MRQRGTANWISIMYRYERLRASTCWRRNWREKSGCRKARRSLEAIRAATCRSQAELLSEALKAAGLIVYGA